MESLYRVLGVEPDADERARYDRLGHERYVRQYLDDSWTADDTIGSATADAADVTRQGTGKAPGGTAEPRGGKRVSRDDGYATASEYYRPGHRVGVESRGSVARTLAALREVLPWLLAHLALLGGLSQSRPSCWAVPAAFHRPRPSSSPS